jgi:hypothetical protein
MQNAAGLVQCYLRVNGYFTACEYPVVGVAGRYQSPVLAEFDVLAIRFPGAHENTARKIRPGEQIAIPDPALGCPADRTDILIGSVCEGRAEFPSLDASAVRLALARFGCCSDEEAEDIATALTRHGATITERGHSLRLISFGTTTASQPQRRGVVLPLRHVVDYLRAFVSASWNVFSCHSTKDTTIAQMIMIERARRSNPSYYLLQR